MDMESSLDSATVMTRSDCTAVISHHCIARVRQCVCNCVTPYGRTVM